MRGQGVAQRHGGLGDALYTQGNLNGAEKIETELGLDLRYKAEGFEAAGGDANAVARLLLQAAEHWVVQFGPHDEDVITARAKADKDGLSSLR